MNPKKVIIKSSPKIGGPTARPPLVRSSDTEADAFVGIDVFGASAPGGTCAFGMRGGLGGDASEAIGSNKNHQKDQDQNHLICIYDIHMNLDQELFIIWRVLI